MENAFNQFKVADQTWPMVSDHSSSTINDVMMTSLLLLNVYVSANFIFKYPPKLGSFALRGNIDRIWVHPTTTSIAFFGYTIMS